MMIITELIGAPRKQFNVMSKEEHGFTPTFARETLYVKMAVADLQRLILTGLLAFETCHLTCSTLNETINIRVFKLILIQIQY